MQAQRFWWGGERPARERRQATLVGTRAPAGKSPQAREPKPRRPHEVAQGRYKPETGRAARGWLAAPEHAHSASGCGSEVADEATADPRFPTRGGCGRPTRWAWRSSHKS